MGRQKFYNGATVSGTSLIMSDRFKTGYEMSHPDAGDEVLITGLSGHFPESGSIAELQENLFNKVNLVTRDDRRWRVFDTDIPHEIGKIRNLENFDASFFGIDYTLAHNVDPMSRLLLERTYEAIIDAGMNPVEFHNTRTGVFTGCCFYGSEKKLLYGNVHCNDHGLSGCAQSNLACRIAQWLKVTGPAYTVDTACSSSIYALEQAFKAIRSGACDSAIVCGVNVVLHPSISAVFNRMGILSPDGKSKSFDASANGYARSEAVVVCLLQKAKDSRRAYAEIVYAKTNCDGFKPNGITYPDGNMQKCLLEEFYKECSISPNDVEFIEAHGTGTAVGDPEELNAIDNVMCKGRTQPLLIGSIKSNIGHAEGASGLCSTTKICIAYHSGYIAPNLHYNKPRKGIPGLTEGRLKVVTEKHPWNRGLASFSGFGFGGANAHVLLRNFNKEKVNYGIPNDNFPRLVCISGRTKSAVELILNSLEEKCIDGEEIRLWHAIHENNIDGHKFRGFAVLKPTPAGTITLSRDVKRYRNTDRPICFVYPTACSQLANFKELMDIPIFASAIYKCNAALKANNVNVIDIISGLPDCSSETINNLHLYISTVALQIGLTDVVNSIGITANTVLGYGIGELGCAYVKEILTAEEAIEKAYYLALVRTETSAANGDKDDCSPTAKDIEKLIPRNALIIQITPELDFKKSLNSYDMNEIEVNLIEKNTKTAVQDLLISLGRLYETGSNLKLAKLYPHISFPVSQSTPMLSHLVEWDHREKWFKESFHDGQTKLNTVERVVKISMDDPDFEYLVGHRIGGRLLFPGSGYLLLAWETLAMMHARVYKEFSVVFENVQFLRVTTIPSKGDLEFHITIHPVSGEFEVRILDTDGSTLRLATTYIWSTIEHGSLPLLGRPIANSTTILQCGLMQGLFKTLKSLIYNNRPVNASKVTENNAAVVTGIIYPKKEIGKVCDKQSYQKHNNNIEGIKLSEKDFYRELKLRGYDYSGLFKGVIESTIDNSYGRVTWNNNWVVFIDYVFQVVAFAKDTRNLYIPTTCAKLSIDTDLHYKTLIDTNIGPDQLYVEVFTDKDTQVTRSGGLEIRDFDATMISKKPDTNIPIIEKYDFMPNYRQDFAELEEIIRLNVDIIIENSQVYKFKAIEVYDEEYEGKKYESALEYIDKILEITAQVWPELSIVRNNNNKSLKIPAHITQLTKFPEDNSAVLVIGANLSKKEQIVKEIDSCLRDGGFIMSREDDVTSVMKLSDTFDIITVYTTGEETVVLLKKKINDQKKTFIKIDGLDQSFSWISKLKEAIEQHNKVVLYACDDISGIIGLVNCLRKEPGSDTIQCLFATGPNKHSFDPESHFYKRQLDKNLAFNILSDDQWGTYRHRIIKNNDVVKPSSHAYLNIETIGDLSSIKWLEGRLKESSQGEDNNNIFVHVYCSALNFRDVVTATGRVAVDSVARGRLAQECVQGFEFSGKLTNGMRVAGMSEKSISNVLLCNRNLLLFVPDEWTFEEAASVMVAYSTVYLAFDVLGKMKSGESILIHAGSGAVGQAAINVALRRGCKVFTTVGTSEKKNFIKKLYPELKDNHIGNSRDTSFEQLIMEQTNGRGVDLVLNSLSEDKLLASVRCLGRKGRFLEIGKYDIFKNTPIEMLLHKKEISFHGVMLDYVFDNVSDGKRLVEFVTKGIVKGEVRPITSCTFKKRDVEAAYRYMASGKHIGKVIIKIREDEDSGFNKPEPMLIEAHRRYICNKDYVYILVGGLGGFGLELADWLILRGARKLVLVSSKGISTGYQARRVGIWTSYGADIRIITDDVTTESGCEKILESAVVMGHVEAIFNLAGILNDGLFQHQSPEMFQKSYKPKAIATLLLDNFSRVICPGLRDFVVFSSLACGRGNSGQSNYGLANSVMERICENRRKYGLPGLAIQWGAIGDVGMLADLQAESGEADVGGIMPQRITSCLQALDTLLLQNDAIVSIYVLARKTVIENNKKTALETVAQIIGLKNLKTVSYQASLADLGMDSIMALEVKQTLERDFDIVLTAQDIRTTTLAKLTSLSKEQQESSTIVASNHSQAKPQVKDDWVFDLRYFLSNFGEEKNAYKPYIFMPTQTFTNNENTNKTSANTLFMIPGLEGCASILEPLCRRLHTEACVLQLPIDNAPRDLQDLTDKLYEVIKPLKAQTKSFNLLGYSYGTIPLLALAAKLETQGHIGTVLCIDGSPTWVNSLFKNKLGISDDDKLQDNIIKYVFEATLPNDSFITSLVEKTSELPNHDDKIDYVIEHSPIELKYSNEFIKRISKASNSRLKIVSDYKDNNIKKIKSSIVLLRPEYGVINEFAENYELDKFTEGDVKVHYLNGNHVSILEDPDCATIIEQYLKI